MRGFWNSIKIVFALFGFTVVLGIGLYFTVPSVKDYANTNILKQEQVDNSAKDAEIEALQLQIEEKTTLVETINVQLSEEREKVEKLEADALADAETIATLQESIETKQSELDAVVLEKENLEAEKATLQSDIIAKRNQIAELESEAEVNSETIATLQSEIEAKQQELDSVNAALETKTTEVENLTSQVSTLIQERDDAINNLSAKQAELDDLQTEVNALQSDLSLKTIEIATLEARIEELESGFVEEGKVYLDSLDNNGLQSLEFYSVGVRTLIFPSYINATTPGSIKGIYELNPDYSINKLYSSDSGWEVVDVYTNGDLLIREPMYGRLLKYVKSENVIQEIITDTSLRDYDLVKCLPNGNIFYFKNDTTNQYAYVLDAETKQSTKIETSIGSYMDSALVLSDSRVLTSGINTNDLVLIDAINFTVEVLSSSYSDVTARGFALSNGNALLAKSTSGSLYLFNGQTKNITVLASSVANVEYFDFNDGNVAIYGMTKTYLYKSATEELLSYSIGTFYFESGHSKVVVSSNNSYFICQDHYSTVNDNLIGKNFIIYDGEREIIVGCTKTQRTAYYDTCVIEENGFKISSSQGLGADLFYSFETGTLAAA